MLRFPGRRVGGGESAYLVVGLGNPESRYDRTRHNIGFRTLDLLAEQLEIRVNRFRFHGIYGQGRLGGVRVLLLKPQTYMNRSGESVQAAAAYFQIPPERVLILYDDVSLPVGKLRIRTQGSAGGHNGVRNIIEKLGTEVFPRIKIGVGEKPDPRMDLADWVLSSFSAQEEKNLSPVLDRAVEAVRCLIEQGPEKAMNRYN